MNKKNVFILIAILFVGFLFRFLMLDKAGGLSYDEIVSFKQASAGNIFTTIIYTLKTDVHMPLYQIFLNLWANIFSFSDLSLRSFSAFFGVLTVLFAFLTGKNLKDTNLGIISGIFFAVNSFFIYYSQEVRMYSFLLFLATLNLFFLVKLKNNPENRWNYEGILLTSLCLIHTYTICFIYVIAEILAILFYLIRKKYKLNHIRNLFILLLIFCFPITLFLTVNSSKYTNQINGYYCDWSSLFILLQDLYSPILESLANNPVHYMNKLFTNFSALIIVLPVIIGIVGLFNAIKKDKNSVLFLFGAVVFFVAEVVAFKITNFKILPRYVSPSMPAFLLLSAYGLTLFKENISKIFITIYLIINVGFLIFSPTASFKLPRQGFRPLAALVNDAGINEYDFVLVWNRKEILDKYLSENVNILSILKDFAYKSEIMLSHEQEFNKYSLDKRKEILHDYFYKNEIPQNTYLLMNYIISNMQSDQKFIITSSESFYDYDKTKFKKLVEKSYNSTSLNDLLTIKSLTDIKEICNKNLKFIGEKRYSGFVTAVYKK